MGLGLCLIKVVGCSKKGRDGYVTMVERTDTVASSHYGRKLEVYVPNISEKRENKN